MVLQIYYGNKRVYHEGEWLVDGVSGCQAELAKEIKKRFGIP